MTEHTEQMIEALCKKFNVTVDGLVNELFKYYTTIDKIGIVVWGVIMALSILSILILWNKFKQWYQLNYWRCLWIIVPIILIFAGLITVPFMIYDLVSWHISPLGAIVDLIM